MILNYNNALKITFYKISFQLNSKQSNKSKGKKCGFQWKFGLYFDFDTFLCFQQEKTSHSLWRKVIFKPCLASWKFKCSITVGAGGTEKVKQGLKYGYKKHFVK